MHAATLKDHHRRVRDGQPESLRVRIHRAISWLSRAEQEVHDPDARYIFLWIAFNAAYASEFGFERTERHHVKQFIDKLLELDAENKLHHALFSQFSGPIRTLVENKHVFEPFWRALREHDGSGAWEASFISSKKVAMKALLGNETGTLLSIVLDRLYVLRNQLVHGGATWGGKTNRAQVTDGASILGTLVPIMLDVMMQAEGEAFEAIAYPVV